jgi:hypothetical protein
VGADQEDVQPEVKFELQFPVEEVAAYASRFDFEHEEEALAIGAAALARGYYARDEFIRICLWKTRRVSVRIQNNSDEEIAAASHAALGGEGIKPLLGLDGVSWGRASTLLHLALPDLYPILDHRAVHALGASWPSAVTFGFWSEFVAAFRATRELAGVSGRELDRALWQWSSEQEEQSLYSAG